VTPETAFLAPSKFLAALALALMAGAGAAAPYTPTSDAQVVERLPLSATDPSVRRVDSLRKQLAAQPANAALRVELARRYFDLSMAQGDPRYVGYAAAAIAPLANQSGVGADYWLARGMLQQYSHDFDGALTSLNHASEIDPRNPEPMAWRAAIFMVQARYAQAQAECSRLAPLVQPLFAAGCDAYVRAQTGQLASAFADLSKAVAAAPGASPELVLWELTRLAEMAIRLQQPAQAEGLFKRALALGVTDQFLLGAWADFLLDHQRPAEVITLLADWERSDILLLRLALAGKAAGHARAADWAAQLRDRFAAAALRGDRLHEQEAARFELDVEGQTAKALTLAERNYGSQRESRDAEILLRCALAAGKPAAAAPALAWLRENHHEDPHLSALADALAAKGTR
jgi:Tfp pilus assembly protein PilF